MTQNVDRLHQSAGSTNVLEMHGTTHEVRCVTCDALHCRRTYQTRLAQLNPDAAAAAVEAAAAAAADDAERRAMLNSVGLSGRSRSIVLPGAAVRAAAATGQQRPDGDVELVPAAPFDVPPCESCGSRLVMPDVVRAVIPASCRFPCVCSTWLRRGV
jgi:NAD-dependent deacetylase sirtuin 4